MKRVLLLYVVGTVIFGLGVTAVLHFGAHLKPPVAAAPQPGALPAAVKAAEPSVWSAMQENSRDPLSRLLLQLVVIVAATRAMGWCFRKIGQPSVIGEIAAGILLGPSLLGWLWPEAMTFVFAKDSMVTLRLISQIGVCVFMFVVGLELDLGHIRSKAQTALLVSHAGMMVPYMLGVAASLLLFPRFGAPGGSFMPFALFLGIAMSITAFPVLVRILRERGIDRTFLGTTAITCAAVEDATAWAVLAIVVALARATGVASTFLNLGLVAAFVALVLFVLRPALAWWAEKRPSHEPPSAAVLALVLIFMSACALTTEIIGIHALFGAFLAGVAMPQRGAFREELTLRLANFSTVFLLPLFFAFSGLRTQVGLLNDVSGWLVALGIVAIAVAGKLGGCTLTARFAGLSWPDAFSLGSLMNTRGLVELVALNIGYDLGILTPRIFTTMVIMALVTTCMTGPLLNLADRLRRRVPAEAPDDAVPVK